MTKAQSNKYNWEEHYNNKLISGIEVRDKDGKLVNFITIKHNEVLEKGKTHRIVLKLDENSKPILPPPRTFEEIIQAKRRQQMLLYGSGTTTSGGVSERTARRLAAASRRAALLAAEAAAQVSEPASHVPETPPLITPVASSHSSRSRSKKKSKKRPRPQPPSLATESPTSRPTTESPADSSASLPATTIIKTEPADTQPVRIETPPAKQPKLEVTIDKSPPKQSEPAPGTSGHILTSMKDLTKNKYSALFDSCDREEVKKLYRMAPPGSSIILPNGNVLKKSRRGGARAGAGRKRSRPLPASQSSTPRSSSGPQPSSSNSSFSSTN